MPGEPSNNTIGLTADIVAAYVQKNAVPVSGLADLIASVNSALSNIGSPSVAAEPKPAVNPKKSVFPDYIISLEDGKKYKSLKRHLSTSHGMTPDEYRAKWGLAMFGEGLSHGCAELFGDPIGLGKVARLGKEGNSSQETCGEAHDEGLRRARQGQGRAFWHAKKSKIRSAPMDWIATILRFGMWPSRKRRSRPHSTRMGRTRPLLQLALTAHFDGRERDYRFSSEVFSKLNDGKSRGTQLAS